MGKKKNRNAKPTSSANLTSADSDDVDSQDGRHSKLGNRQSVSLDLQSLEAIRELIRDELHASLIHLKREILELKTDNSILKNIIVSQQQQFERMEMDKRACNLIVNGVTEPSSTSPDTEVIDKILENIWPERDNRPIKFDVVNLRRIGKMGTRPRPVVLTFASRDSRDKVLKTASSLRNITEFNKIYISPDLPLLTRKENTRLRLAFKELKASSPTSTVILKYGKLTVNGNEVDRFNLANQLFREAVNFE